MADNYIAELMNQKISVTVYTVNGYQLKGVIFSIDNECIILLSGGKKRIVYKHAISTIDPA